VPLEKEIIKLGGNLDSEGNQNNIDLQLGRFLPKNPFIEDTENIHFWEDENSDYYKFSKSLFKECLEKEWIKIKKSHYTYTGFIDFKFLLFLKSLKGVKLNPLLIKK